MPTISQEKKKREEGDPQLQEFMETFSAKDAILEQGIAKSFEQLSITLHKKSTFTETLYLTGEKPYLWMG